MMMLQEIRFDKRSQPVVPQNVHLLQAVHWSLYSLHILWLYFYLCKRRRRCGSGTRRTNSALLNLAYSSLEPNNEQFWVKSMNTITACYSQVFGTMKRTLCSEWCLLSSWRCRVRAFREPTSPIETKTFDRTRAVEFSYKTSTPLFLFLV
jgi:hypothetical protein